VQQHQAPAFSGIGAAARRSAANAGSATLTADGGGSLNVAPSVFTRATLR